MTRLVLINGAPGSGKSTLASALARRVPMMLALDVDALKHSLGDWADDPTAAGLHARRLAIALAREHLEAGSDVVIGQYLAKTEFIEALEALSAETGARFIELVLELDASALAERLSARSNDPTRAEHLVNNQLVGPEDADQLVASMRQLRAVRPQATRIEASGSVEEALDALWAVLAPGT